MEFVTFKELLGSAALVRRDLPGIAQDFCERLEAHGEVQLNLASGKVFSIHQGDSGYISERCLTVRLFDGRIININWEQVEYCWTHMANDD
jgi:hypothetical protein